MFTLKLWKLVNGQKIHKTLAYHHVQTMVIGHDKETLEVWAFHDKEPSHYDTFYIGKREETMTAISGDGDHSFWQWGLLENMQGRTTEHYRPSSYGFLD